MNYQLRLYFLALSVHVGLHQSTIAPELYVRFNRRKVVMPGRSWFEVRFSKDAEGLRYIRRFLFLRYSHPGLTSEHSQPARFVQVERFINQLPKKRSDRRATAAQAADLLQ